MIATRKAPTVERPVPAAVLRLEPAAEPPVAQICAWHGAEAKREADAWAERNGWKASHGICRECADREFGGRDDA